MSNSWKPRQVPPKSFGDGWIGEAFGSKQHFDLRRTPESVTMTGNDVTTVLKIPYPHRLNKVEAKHTDAAGDDDLAELTRAVFQRKKWSGTTDWFDLYDFSGEAASDFEQVDLVGREFPSGQYRFIVNTTENDLMFYLVTIQILGKKGKEYVRSG